MGTELKKLVLNPGDVIKGFHLTQVQDNIGLAIKSLNNSDFINGTVKSLPLLVGIDNIINHGLDREVQGWTVIDKNANSDVWQSTSVNNFKSKQIILKCSADVTVKIYFF